MGKLKPFEELTFHDDFMFGHIMKDKDICKTAMEILLDIKIDRIEYPELQKTVAPFYTSKGIRMDVYVDDGRRVYDVEIQNSEEVNLGKRTRYYQSMLDIDSLMQGQSYEELKESIIIFLCRYDPFKKDFPCYTVRRICEQDTSIRFKDDAILHIFNCKAYKNAGNAELRAFLKFIETNSTESEFTRRLYKMVETQKEREELKTSYFGMSLFEQDARIKGRKEGRAEGLQETARNLLAMNILSHEQIAQAVGLPLESIEQLSQQMT